MKKRSILLLLAAPILSIAASNYQVIILKTQNNYTLDGATIEPEDPIESAYDLSFQAWRDVSVKDLSLYMPMAMDGSSNNQAHYKINVGQEDFKGNPAGFLPFDENYDVSKLNNCNSEKNGFCSAGNLLQVNYEHTNSSGKYYFEIESLNQAHADCVGLSNITAANISNTNKISVCYAGNYSAGSKWTQDNSYIEYRKSGSQPTGTVYQVWIDYDNERASIMETGTTLANYTNYDVVSEDFDIMGDKPWKQYDYRIDNNKLMPTIFDGSSNGNSKYAFNFGQRPFKGDYTGFLPYDSSYDKSNWVGVYAFHDNDEYLQPFNTNYAYYNKSHNSGKYYFEVTSASVTTNPYYDAIGFIDLDSKSYNNVVGALITGTGMQGYNLGSGRGVYSKFKTSGVQPAQTTFQVFIDYDKGMISVVTLGSNKSDYQNYYEVLKAE